MTDAVTIAYIGMASSVLTAALSAFVAMKQSRQGKDMKELAKNTNSIKDALIASTATASHAEGKAEGVAEERAKA